MFRLERSTERSSMRVHAIRRSVAALVLGGALIAGTAACGSDDEDEGAAATPGSSQAAAPSAGSTGGSTSPATPGAPGGTANTAPGTSSAAPRPTASGGTQNGTRTVEGAIQYLAPGKYIVNGDQSFMVATDTKILGGGAFCAPSGGGLAKDAQGYGTNPCTEEALEEAAKSPQSATFVKVVIEKNGVAVSVTEKIPG
jgi:hypothetical protein